MDFEVLVEIANSDSWIGASDDFMDMFPKNLFHL